MRKIVPLLMAILTAGISCNKDNPSEPVGSESLSGYTVYSGTTIPVSGATVRIQGKSTTTASDGRYQFDALTPGNSTLSATKAGHDDYSISISVVPGNNVKDIPMTSALYTHKVWGLVKSSTGDRLQGVVVTVLNDDSSVSSLSTFTDFSGYYQVPGVPQGQRDIKYSKYKYQISVAQIIVSNSDYVNNVQLIYNGLCAGDVGYPGGPYPVILVGNQCWLAKNLNVGTMIAGTSNQSANRMPEKYCYNNDTNNCSTYGGLYQWHEAMEYSTTPASQGMCPPGWHIPTVAEFQTLTLAVGGDGNSLKAVGEGTGAGAGTNTSGFSALLAGDRGSSGGFGSLVDHAFFWSSSEGQLTDDPYYMILSSNEGRIDFGSGVIGGNHNFKVYGHSVRCLED